MRFSRAFAEDSSCCRSPRRGERSECFNLRLAGNLCRLLGENRVVMLCRNVLRGRSIVALCVAACCLVAVIFASLALFGMF